MKSTVIDTVTTRLPIAAQAMPVALSTSVVSKPPCSLPLRFVWMAGRCAGLLELRRSHAVNLYAAVLHKSVMRVDIFYASDNFFRLHKSFLL